MQIILTRFDGCFFVGQLHEDTLHYNVLFNPAVIVHMPVQVQSRIGNQTGVAFQTNIVFLECDQLRLPADITPTMIGETELLAKHYNASLENYKRANTAPSGKTH